jgi:hypothetical protein
MSEYINEQFDEVCRSFVSAMQRVVERIKAFRSGLNTLAFKVYEDAGYPYGNSPAGFQLWIEDQSRHYISLNDRKN